MQEYTASYTQVNTLGTRVSLTGASGVEVGHVYVFLITNDLHEEPYALLEDLCVIISQRSKGVGNALLTEAIKLATERGCYKILATSRTEREEVHAWYTRKGFEKFGFEFRMNLDQGTNSKEQ